MKILRRDLKEGIVKVMVQDREDCWHLYSVIERGDRVSSVTYRTKKDKGDKARSKKEEKERVYITIEVEDKEFQKFTDRLRIRGRIVEGVEEIGAYHTFNVEPGMELKIEKDEWKRWQLERLERATKKHPKMVVVAMDDESATIARLHEYGVEEVATIYSGRSGKMYEDESNTGNYYQQILSKIKAMNVPVAIVGPGFEKDRFVEFAKSELKDYIVDNVSQAGMTGVYEAIKRGVVERIMKENRVAKETAMLEQVMKEISRGGAVAYGKEEVRKAVETGAVELLLVENNMLMEEEEIIKKAEEMGARVEIISEWHEGGQKLHALGGIAALLRYRLNY